MRSPGPMEQFEITITGKLSRITDLLLLENFGKGAVYTLCVEIQAELSDDQAASFIEQLPVSTEELKEIHHERSKIILFRVR